MKMRKFADKGIVREGKNKNIDDETRARAMASVAGLSKPKPSAGPVAVPDKPSAGPVAVPDKLRQDQSERIARLADKSVDSSRVLETPTEAPASRPMASAAPVAAGPMAAAPKAKPAIVTLQQLNAFRKEFGADKDLTDYMNAQAGGLKRRNKANPDMETPPAEVPVARSEVKNTSDDLRAKSQEQQARGARLRNETDAVLGENAQKLKADFKRSLGVKDFLESSDYAKGGVVSASRRGDGIAQRGKTRGKMY